MLYYHLIMLRRRFNDAFIEENKINRKIINLNRRINYLRSQIFALKKNNS
jgi:hypothetical protein